MKRRRLELRCDRGPRKARRSGLGAFRDLLQLGYRNRCAPTWPRLLKVVDHHFQQLVSRSPDLLEVGDELLVSSCPHLLDHQLGVAQYMAERRAQIVEQVARKYVMDAFLDGLRKFAHDSTFASGPCATEGPINASIFSRSLGSSI